MKILSSGFCVASLLATSIAYADSWSSLEAAEDGPAGQAPSNSQPPAQVVVNTNAAPTPSPQTTSRNSGNAGSMGSGAAQILFSEIEVLKQEVQELRGLVEEQTYELKKLKAEQKERYIDLDRRMSQRLQGAPSNAADPATAEPVDEGGASAVSEKGQYDNALRFVQERKFPEAIAALQSFLQTYPSSSYAVNGYYWLGQIFYIQNNLDEARKAFTIVVNQYPQHQKTADSRYKLGVLLHKLGETAKAKKMLKAVASEYAQSSPGTARLAENYLNQNFQ